MQKNGWIKIKNEWPDYENDTYTYFSYAGTNTKKDDKAALPSTPPGWLS